MSVHDEKMATRRGLSEEVAEHVRNRIIAGELRPGEFLRIDDVAAELQISVTPVREGLLDLRGQGFLELMPRRGFAVLPLRRSDFVDVFWVQAVLDSELAERAAMRATDADLATLGQLQADLVEAVNRDDIKEANELAYEFHHAINVIADAPKIAWLASIADRYVPRRFFDIYAQSVRASVDDHAEILRALRLRDSKAAREAMAGHVRRAGDLLVLHLESLPILDGSDDGAGERAERISSTSRTRTRVPRNAASTGEVLD